MEKFTHTSRWTKERVHHDFDDALRIVGYIHKTPLAVLRELIAGKIKEIKLPGGTITMFDATKKRSPEGV